MTVSFKEAYGALNLRGAVLCYSGEWQRATDCPLPWKHAIETDKKRQRRDEWLAQCPTGAVHWSLWEQPGKPQPGVPAVRDCCPREQGENPGDGKLWRGRGYEKGKARLRSLAPVRFASLTSSVHRAHERVRAWLSSLLGAKIAAVKETGKRQADTKEKKAEEERKRTWKHYPQNQGRHASHVNF